MNEIFEAYCSKCSDINSKNWFAWINRMPPGPTELHVTGEIEVPNPGVETILIPKSPPGTNPTILMLDLFLCQLPGSWPRVMVWKQVHYHKFLSNEEDYETVEIYCDDEKIADIPISSAK